MTAFSEKEADSTSARQLLEENHRWDAFLQRTTRHRTTEQHPSLEGRRVLITGAGGWIGSALARALALSRPAEIILLDTAEGALHAIGQMLLERCEATPHTAVLASVCDPSAIADLFDRYRPEIVFHAGALKHVPLMETNPFAAVSNNALGTHVLAEAANRHGCEQMIMVSTDKAVDPLSLMGASKRIAELVMLAPQSGSMRRKSVRLGNVLGSSGSVVPLFLRQIAHGGPVTVSDPEVRRYFMTTTETVDALLSAQSPSCPDGLLVPQLGNPIRILDLAKYLIAQTHRHTNGSTPNQTTIVFTALRPGDKLEESLISTRESYTGQSFGPLRLINSPALESDELTSGIHNLRQAVQHRDLPFLLEAIQHLVPEYQPSSLLREQINAALGAVVSA